MFVLESSSASIWDSVYVLKGELDTFDQFAIDGTYFQHPTGLYHIYSCWYDGLQSWPSNLCVTKRKRTSPSTGPPKALFFSAEVATADRRAKCQIRGRLYPTSLNEPSFRCQLCLGKELLTGGQRMYVFRPTRPQRFYKTLTQTKPSSSTRLREARIRTIALDSWNSSLAATR